MKVSSQNIYPLNESNLKALLSYYFPNYATGDIPAILEELKFANICLKEMEHTCQKIQKFIPILESNINTEITSTNILSYSIEVFYDYNWNLSGKSENRKRIINIIKDEAGLPAYNEEDNLQEVEVNSNDNQYLLEEALFEEEERRQDLKNADWDYDHNNPAHHRSENPWIDVFGPGEEAETAYWNTH